MSDISGKADGSRIFTVGWFHDYSPVDGTCLLRSGESNRYNDSCSVVVVDVSSCVMHELDKLHEHCLCRVIGTVLKCTSTSSVKVEAQSIRATPSWDYCNFTRRIELNKKVMSLLCNPDSTLNS